MKTQITAFLALVCLGVLAQNQYIDSLKDALKRQKHEEQTETLILLANSFLKSDPQQCIEIAKEIEQLALKNRNYEANIKAHMILAKAYRKLGIMDSVLHYYSECEKLCISYNNDECFSKLYINFGGYYRDLGEYLKAIAYYTKSKTLGIALKNDQRIIASCNNNIGNAYRLLNYHDSAEVYLKQACNQFKELNENRKYSIALFNYGLVLKEQNKISQAMECFKESLTVLESADDKYSQIYVLSAYIGVLEQVGEFDKAYNYIHRNISLAKTLQLKDALFNSYDYMTYLFINKQVYDSATYYFRLSDSVLNTGLSDNILNVVKLEMNRGYLAYQSENYKQVIAICNKTEQICIDKNMKYYLADTYKLKSDAYFELNKLHLALNYINKAIDLKEKIQGTLSSYEFYKLRSTIYKELGNTDKALLDLEKYYYLADSVQGIERYRAIKELETQYETEKKEAQIKVQQLTLANQDITLKQRRVFNWILAGGMFVISIILFQLFRNFNLKKKANTVLREKNKTITDQKDQIEYQKEEITASIHYAHRIQTAMLSSLKPLSQLTDSLLYYKPRDIVSGDFYWVNKHEDDIYILIGDCTGHGVPGAFMSMLGLSLLNEISKTHKPKTSGDLLNQLRKYIIESLKQTDVDSDNKDGMDVSLVKINIDSKAVEFSGAYNPLYQIRNNELTEYKADRMPIGISDKKDVNFSSSAIDAIPNDSFYMFSDGFVDQFGGTDGKKLKAKKFKELLIEINEKPMEIQKQIIDDYFKNWKGKHEQVDDIIIFGFKI